MEFGSAQPARRSLRKVASTKPGGFWLKNQALFYLTYIHTPIFKPELFWRLAETSWKKSSACPPDPPVPSQAMLSDVAVVLSLKNHADKRPASASPGHKRPSKQKLLLFLSCWGQEKVSEAPEPVSLQRAAASPRGRDAGSRHPTLEQPPRVTAALLLSFLGNASLQIINFIHLFMTHVCLHIYPEKSFFFFDGNTCICKHSNMPIAC